MTPKRITTACLLLFAAGSAIYVLLGGPALHRATGESETSPPLETAAEVVVYYMDMGKDCTTCENLESYTRAALDAHFSEELASGRLVWRTADLDLPENEHFISEFKLYTKSVVLIRQADGAMVYWDSLSRIWELVYDKDAYTAYIRASVQLFLDSPEAPE